MSPTLAPASVDVDFVVIGAGVAGLAAAAELRRAGLSVLVLEAGHRIGGRAWTEHPAVLGGHEKLDHGASWLHAAHRNALIPLARAQGETVEPDIPWDDRVRIFTETGQTAAKQAYEAAETRWNDAVTARLAGTDCSLAEAAAPVAADPWTPTIETWEGAIIAGADPDVLSLQDWHTNALDGANFVAPGGLGALLARCLGAEAGPVQFNARVKTVTALPDGVQVTTQDGESVRAGAAIVTVSTGVLRAESIRFSPPLPAKTRDALAGLPMGLLSKIALAAKTDDRLGLPAGTGIFRRIATRGAPGISIIFWPDESHIALGFVGGRAAWDFSANPRAAIDFLLAEIASMLGADARRAFDPNKALMTGWGTDADFFGAYAYATPGNAGARKKLNSPIWDGKLRLAGEACVTDGLAGTVAGAYESGRKAARESAAFLQKGGARA